MRERLTGDDRALLLSCYRTCQCDHCKTRRGAIERALRVIDGLGTADPDVEQCPKNFLPDDGGHSPFYREGAGSCGYCGKMPPELVGKATTKQPEVKQEG